MTKIRLDGFPTGAAVAFSVAAGTASASADVAEWAGGAAPPPPLLLNTICFAIGGTLGLIWTAMSGQLGALRTVPLHVYAMGTLGLFGYHALYFTALRLAPAAEASLIAYLWPLDRKSTRLNSSH